MKRICVKFAGADRKPLPGYALRFWGMDRKGDQVNSLLTFGTLRAARSAIAASLFKYGARARFWISL